MKLQICFWNHLVWAFLTQILSKCAQREVLEERRGRVLSILMLKRKERWHRDSTSFSVKYYIRGFFDLTTFTSKFVELSIFCWLPIPKKIKNDIDTIYGLTYQHQGKYFIINWLLLYVCLRFYTWLVKYWCQKLIDYEFDCFMK